MGAGRRMLIGFIGGIGAGKTSATNYLKHEYGFDHITFAKPMKDFVVDVFGCDPEDVHTQAGKAKEREELGGETFRKVLEELGSWARKFDEDVWIKRGFRANQTALRVVEDVRYPNEVNEIRAEGGVLIRIDRLFYTTPRTGHASDDWGNLDYDYLVAATSLQHLYDQLDDVLRQVRKVEQQEDEAIFEARVAEAVEPAGC